MVNVARNSLEEAKDKMKTVIKSCLPCTRLGSFEGDERHTVVHNCFFFLNLTLPCEDEQTTGVLLVHVSWIHVQRVRYIFGSGLKPVAEEAVVLAAGRRPPIILHTVLLGIWQI